MAVLPLLASSTILPGVSSPVASACSIIVRAMRSFTEPPGFIISSFTRISTPGTGFMRLIRTSGVFPINSRTELTLYGNMTITKPLPGHRQPRTDPDLHGHPFYKGIPPRVQRRIGFSPWQPLPPASKAHATTHNFPCRIEGSAVSVGLERAGVHVTENGRRANRLKSRSGKCASRREVCGG